MREVAIEVTFDKGTETIEKCAFYKINKAEKVVLPNSLKNIDDFAFMKSSVIHLEIPEGVTRIGDGAFCHSIIDFKDDFIPSTVETIGMGAFKKSRIPDKLKLPNSVKYVGSSAFRNTNIKQVVLSESLTEIDDYTFADCNYLDEVTIPDSVKIIGKGAFWNCKNLKKVILPANLEYIDEDAFSGTGIKTIVFPNSLKHIGAGAFEKCSNLKAVSCPSGLEGIASKAFSRSGVVSIVLSESVKVAPNAFIDCNITDVTLLPADTKNLRLENNTLINHENCMICSTDKKVLRIPDGQRDLSFIPNADTIEELYLPSSIRSIDMGRLTTCHNLRSIVAAEDNNNYYSENGALYRRDRSWNGKIIVELAFVPPMLEEYVIPENVNVIGYYAFNNNTALKSISIPDSVQINDGAFDGASMLEEENNVYYVGTLGYAVKSHGFIEIREGTTKLADSFFMPEKYQQRWDDYKNHTPPEVADPFGEDCSDMIIKRLIIPSTLIVFPANDIMSDIYTNYRNALGDVFFKSAVGKIYKVKKNYRVFNYNDVLSNVLEYMHETNESKAETLWQQNNLEEYLEVMSNKIDISLAGKTFFIKDISDPAKLENLISNKGGTVVKAMTPRPDYIVTEGFIGKDKILGIPVITKEDLIKTSEKQ